jgi:hypothetical protein
VAADSAANSTVSEPYVQQPVQQPSSPSARTALQPQPEVAGGAQSTVPNATATTVPAEDSSQHDSQHSSMPEQQHGSSIPPFSSRPPAAAPAQSVPRQNGVAPGPPSDSKEVAKLRSQLQRLKAQLVASASSAEEDAERQAAAAGEQASTLQRQRDELQASLHAAQQQLAAQQAATAQVGAPLIVKQAIIAPAGDRQLLVGAAAWHSIRHIQAIPAALSPRTGGGEVTGCGGRLGDAARGARSRGGVTSPGAAGAPECSPAAPGRCCPCGR